VIAAVLAATPNGRFSRSLKGAADARTTARAGTLSRIAAPDRDLVAFLAGPAQHALALFATDAWNRLAAVRLLSGRRQLVRPSGELPFKRFSRPQR